VKDKDLIRTAERGREVYRLNVQYPEGGMPRFEGSGGWTARPLSQAPPAFPLAVPGGHIRRKGSRSGPRSSRPTAPGRIPGTPTKRRLT
jgi:hypothetical protein